jgi:hypothetical protein
LIDIHFIPLTERARHLFGNTDIPKAAENMKWTKEMLKFLFKGYHRYFPKVTWRTHNPDDSS